VRWRLRPWLQALADLARAIVTGAVALVLLGALVLGIALLPLAGLGIPVLAGALNAVRSLADLQRARAGRVLGRDLTVRYSATPSWRWEKLRPCVRDRRTHRDALWLVVQAMVGAVLAGVSFGVSRVADTFSNNGNPALLLPSAVLLAALYWMVPWLERGQALLTAALLGPTGGDLARRVAELTESRASTVDAQAAELRRIERDLHDGAQARLAAVGMGLGMAAQVLRSDPDQAERLLEESRGHARRALAELRALVRGIHPPVLADRGLPGGLQAAALMCPVPVDVAIELPGRPEPPVESAVYFAAAEALANVGRHARAGRAWLHASHTAGWLRVVVGDDGVGGACAGRGSGLRGIERRLAAFDGRVTVSSPVGGPTEVRMEVPCALSSPRTPSSSATG
jgi:signal transduction histidine kinase